MFQGSLCSVLVEKLGRNFSRGDVGRESSKKNQENLITTIDLFINQNMKSLYNINASQKVI